MSVSIFSSALSRGKNYKYRSIIKLVLIGSLLLSAILLTKDAWDAAKKHTQIVRNNYGKGDKTELLEVTAGSRIKREPLEITVPERKYTNEEMQNVFGEACKKLRTCILGSNKSLDEIYTDMKLVTSIPGEPVEVEWEIDRYDVINIYGELQAEALRKETEGVLVNLRALLTYTEDPSMEMLEAVSARLYPPQKTKKEQAVDKIRGEITETDKKNTTKEIIKLPKKVEGQTIEYQKPMDYRGFFVLGTGIIIAVLLVCMEKQNIKKEEELRKRQMMMDYPGIVNKMYLLLGAGMTVKRAWFKIVSDYELQKKECGMRFAYEEMKAACHEMHSGVTEASGYERFGHRCKVQAYVKFGALLSQNLRKGTRGLADLLRIESIHAFEERKTLAKRLGEEAGTKLLGPMFLMLGIVLVMVTVPAVLTIQV